MSFEIYKEIGKQQRKLFQQYPESQSAPHKSLIKFRSVVGLEITKFI